MRVSALARSLATQTPARRGEAEAHQLQLVRESGTRGAHVTVWRPVDEAWKTVALELAATLRRLRYRVAMRVVPGDVRLAYFGPVGDPKNRAQAGPGMGAGPAPGGQMINVLFSCRSPSAFRLSQYCNHSVDTLARDAGDLQATSPVAAADKWAEADRAIVKASPVVPIAILG
jgi:hypothetical protein